MPRIENQTVRFLKHFADFLAHLLSHLPPPDRMAAVRIKARLEVEVQHARNAARAVRKAPRGANSINVEDKWYITLYGGREEVGIFVQAVAQRVRRAGGLKRLGDVLSGLCFAVVLRANMRRSFLVVVMGGEERMELEFGGDGQIIVVRR